MTDSALDRPPSKHGPKMSLKAQIAIGISLFGTLLACNAPSRAIDMIIRPTIPLSTPLPQISPTSRATLENSPSLTAEPTDVPKSWAVDNINEIDRLLNTKEFWTGENDGEPVLVDQFDPKQFENIDPLLHISKPVLQGIERNACGPATAINIYNAYFKLKNGVSPHYTIGNFINLFYGKTYTYTDGKSYSYFEPNGEMKMISLIYALQALDPNQDLYVIDHIIHVQAPDIKVYRADPPSLSSISGHIGQGSIGVGLGWKYGAGHIVNIINPTFDENTQTLSSIVLDSRGNISGKGQTFNQTRNFTLFWDESPQRYGSYKGVYALFDAEPVLK